MFRSFLLAAFIFLAGTLWAGAQETDVIRQLESHPEYLAGTDYLCPAGPVALSPAPKGSTAF